MTTHDQSHGQALYGLYLLGIVATLAGNLLIRVGSRTGWLPPPAQVLLAVVAAAPLAVAAFLFWRLLRGTLDEMLQRIVLEGVAFAVIVYFPFAALYMNLRAANAWIPRLDAADVVLAPALLVAIGVAVARGRYA